MDINDKIKAEGHLEVIKQFSDGTEELVFEDHNVICSGLGQSIAEYMSKEECGTVNVSVSSCGPTLLPGMIPEGEDSQLNFEADDNADLNCCVGLLDITAAVTFTPGPTKTSVTFEATIQIDTITECDEDMPCEGGDSPWPNALTCIEKIEKFNEQFEAPYITGTTGIWGGFNGEVLTFKYQQSKKLGCCTPGCPDKSNSTTTEFEGTIAGGWIDVNNDGNSYLSTNKRELQTDFTDQVTAAFGFGGSGGEPDFPECCIEEEEAPPRIGL